MVSAHGGTPKRLTEDVANDVLPSFSQDGKFIYFTSDRTGRDELFRKVLANGTEVQVTSNGGALAQQSLDRTMLYYVDRSSQGPVTLKQVPTAGGIERALPLTVIQRAFRVVSDGVYFIGPVDGKPSTVSQALQFYNPRTEQTHLVRRVQDWVYQGLSVSPDRKAFYYTATEGTGYDLMLVENWR
jgi:hypothetical protein